MKTAIKVKKPVGKKKKAPLRGAQRLPDAESSGGQQLPEREGTPTQRATAASEVSEEPLASQRALGEELQAQTAGLVPWRRVSGETPEELKTEEPNPLLKLSEEDRAKLFIWLRECPYDDAVRHVLKDQGLGEVNSIQLMEFFQREAERHWEKRVSRAAIEANALVELVEKSPVKFSSGILAALGQEAFRQIASGEVAPESMGRIATLFLKARSDERSERMQELRREKLNRELQGQIDHALEKLAEEVEKNPVAKEAFEALRREIQKNTEAEEGGV